LTLSFQEPLTLFDWTVDMSSSNLVFSIIKLTTWLLRLTPFVSLIADTIITQIYCVV